MDTNEDKSLDETKQPAKEEIDKKDEEEKAVTEEATAKEEEEAAEEGEVEAEGVEEEKVEEVTEEAEETEAEEAAPAEAEEEEKAEEAEEIEEKEKKRGEIPEEEIVEERTYTIPLSRAWIAPRKKRVPRAMRMVKAFIEKHMKIETGAKAEEEEEEEGRLVISEEVNQKLWSRGIEKPPRNIRVRAVKDKEGTVTLYLAEGD